MVAKWLQQRWSERTTHIGIAIIILVIALVIDGTLPDWHRAVLPVAISLILILVPDTLASIAQFAPLIPGGQAIAALANAAAQASEAPNLNPDPAASAAPQPAQEGQ